MTESLALILGSGFAKLGLDAVARSPRSLMPIVSPRDSTTARSIEFSSSRTFPGQEYDMSAAAASGERPLTFLPISEDSPASRYSVIVSMSSFLFLSGGMYTRTTESR